MVILDYLFTFMGCTNMIGLCGGYKELVNFVIHMPMYLLGYDCTSASFASTRHKYLHNCFRVGCPYGQCMALASLKYGVRAFISAVLSWNHSFSVF